MPTISYLIITLRFTHNLSQYIKSERERVEGVRGWILPAKRCWWAKGESKKSQPGWVIPDIIPVPLFSAPATHSGAETYDKIQWKLNKSVKCGCDGKSQTWANAKKKKEPWTSRHPTSILDRKVEPEQRWYNHWAWLKKHPDRESNQTALYIHTLWVTQKEALLQTRKSQKTMIEMKVMKTYSIKIVKIGDDDMPQKGVK